MGASGGGNGGYILAIESSTYEASCALFAPNETEAMRSAVVPTRGAQGEQLLPAIDAMLRDAGVEPDELARVVCGAGPGSFTSLRVGASIAKGLARGLDIPLASVPSLALLVQGGERPSEPGRYLAVMDAMRDERFVQGVEIGSDGSLTIRSVPMRIPAEEVRPLALRLGAITIGPHHDVEIVQGPHARGVMRLPNTLHTVVDLASWEPDYGRAAEAQVKWEAAHGRPLGIR
jgi:tRNA threonylcarbamoyladenosine biosynthesis protein TsaB